MPQPSPRRLVRGVLPILLLAAGALVGSAPALAAGSPYPNQFTLFESGQVRPLALDERRRLLYAVNTPDNRLEIFRLRDDASGHSPVEHLGSVKVGLEPVAVAVRSRREVWVVNHLSDSVSIVDVSNPRAAAVVRTLLVGDEPRDLVFAGPGRRRAFITTAHRGQNHPLDPQLTTPGVGRADVWVFDAPTLESNLAGAPETIVTLFADTPRALAVSPDGSRVYAAAFHSGNKTTIVNGLLVTNGGENASDGMGLPPPTTNFLGQPQPESGLIVRHDGSHWVDELGRSWDDRIRFNLPDQDVFTLDAMADPPRQVAGAAGSFAGVGTILYNLAVHPRSGAVYVANTEAVNHIRFEGPGTTAGHTVRGRFHQTRITVINGGETGAPVAPRHLNKHVDFDACCEPLPNTVAERSLALPLEMAFSADGSALYLAAFGSGKVGIFSTSALERDSFVPSAADHIEVSGGGPSGLVLDEARGRLYVLTRFDNGLSVIDTAARRETHHLRLFNPEPADVVTGRPLLYDARRTSSNGTVACASCHVFGDFDSLAWDLGNPDALELANPGPFIAPPFLPDPALEAFRPMKGPMATQSLRGMANHGPMHWRGDRTGANDAASVQPDGGLFDERSGFKKFNDAFVGLNGRHAPLLALEIAQLTDFVLNLTYPPNPIRNLDNSLTPAQARGRDHFMVTPDTIPFGAGTAQCVTCHVFNPGANAEHGVKAPGFFGSDGQLVLEGDDFLTPENGNDIQAFKVAHFRNQYQKVGMFGLAQLANTLPGDTNHKGDQIRGFGFRHDGAVDTIFRFMSIVGFSEILAPNGFAIGPAGDALRRDVEDFLLAFDSNQAPIVGQQLTLGRNNEPAAYERVALLLSRAAATPAECEVVATRRHGGREESWLYLAASGRFHPAEHGGRELAVAQLLDLARHSPLTLTAVPLGSGERLGLDADLDGCYDGTEERSGFDPRDAASRPADCGP